MEGDNPAVDPYDLDIVGRSAGGCKDACLVESAFTALGFPLDGIEVFHTDIGSELDNKAIDELLGVFGIERSLSKKGHPCDGAVCEPTNKILETEFVCRESFSALRKLSVILDVARVTRTSRRRHTEEG
uniref:hypothetical protein n=1 Tax=Olsenella uli TaxID=133926 RepID=UPI0028EDD4AC|nr:hypothetical protein [Olsenella uli]